MPVLSNGHAGQARLRGVPEPFLELP